MMTPMTPSLGSLWRRGDEIVVVYKLARQGNDVLVWKLLEGPGSRWRISLRRLRARYNHYFEPGSVADEKRARADNADDHG